MIKVAIILERADIALGGAERSIFELTRCLRANGVDVTLLAAKGKAQSGEVQILCTRKGKRITFKRFGKLLRRHFAENTYDIIHSTLPYDFADIYQPRGGSYPESIIQNAASYESAFKTRYKKLTHFTNLRRTQLVLAEKRLCRPQCSTIVAALSEYVKSQFVKHYHLSADRVRVIHNGVKLVTKLEPDAAKALQSQVRAKLGIAPGDKATLFLFAANNFRLKGLAQLIQALATVRKIDTEAEPYVVVAGSDSSQKYRAIAKDLNVANRIVFLGSLRSIQNALEITDLAVLPTFYDPCSRFILEALARGKPAITTKYNGAGEAFTDTVHGKRVDDPRNTEQLAQAMTYFCNEDNLRNAKHAIKEDGLAEKVSIDRHSREIIELYKDILKRKRS
ncbi:Lipopolysaccharide core biosynthesis protein RfaG [Anaerohalosphaera lusitana]|uniref:Lipopolysaccharide core biosynthesis protein RfaG n=1 Tax=Anaerohalosphaera lusitana TaxID=1936003 RepID=A0A1U9NMB6_9BACT|nr:glycosyltransferase family 4 protein [Anaerohalosphaera lusitana]AQT68947.1 Lipopolysaccharide core biosynthesis protein RfaG [Anaerohalosphaera lusitana]